MKKNSLWFLAGLVLCLIACEDDDIPIPSVYGGYVTALKNGEEWKGYSWGHFSIGREGRDTVDLQVAIFDERGGSPIETVGFANVPYQVGTCSLNEPDSWSNILCESSHGTFFGHQVSGHYTVDFRDTTNFLEITEVDYGRNELRGRFQATMIRVVVNPPAGYIPDTVRFTNGEFLARLSE